MAAAAELLCSKTVSDMVMTGMKKILQSSAFASFLGLALAFPHTAAADGLCPPGWESLCKLDLSKSDSIIGGIVGVLFVISIISCLFFLVWAGVRWIQSGGDQAKVAAARSMIIAALVGLVITMLSYFIINFLVLMFTGQGVNSLPVPKLVP